MVITALMIASDSLAFCRGDQGESARQSPKPQPTADELFRDALLLSTTAEREIARQRLQQAMRLWVQAHEPKKAARAALQMGDRYKQARDYREALAYYRQAQEVESVPAAVQVDALNAIALVYAELYESDLAEHYFKKAREQAVSLNDPSAQRLALSGLAHLYYQQKKNAQAQACIAQARQLGRQKHDETEADLLYLLGQIKQGNAAIEDARGAFKEALAISEKNWNAAGQIRALCALSSLSLLASQKPTALELATRAVKMSENLMRLSQSHSNFVGVRELLWRALLCQARAYRALGDKKEAANAYWWLVGHYNGVWIGWALFMATETSALAFQEEGQVAFREYVDLLIDLGQVEEAYVIAEEAKARTMLNRIRARQVKPPAADSKQEALMSEHSRQIARLRPQLLDPSASPERRASLQRQIEDEEIKLREIQSADDIAHAVEHMVHTQPIKPDEMIKKMARDQMALAEFSLGEEHSFLWLFTPDKFFHATLPPKRQIEKAVTDYLDLLSNHPNPLYIDRDLVKLKTQGESLFDTLFGSLAAQVESNPRLIVVPDGLLHYLPFETLSHKGRYLIQDHTISYNPSAGMLALWQDAESQTADNGQMELLAIGDPDFEPEARVGGTKELASRLKDRARRASAVRGGQLTSLPRTRDEIRHIAGLFPAGRRKVLLGKQGTEAALKREPLRRYRRLHFATHSQINEKSPWRSAVVLTPDEDGEEDGLLEAHEIMRLDLDCDLVVVSACQTGRGQLLSGEGIVGLSRAFLRAGARQVVVSLWNVSDGATSQLMKDFYDRLTGGLSNVAALRRAKLDMLDGGKETRHPYYWSSFVLVGKP
jgi:CHAT domain-containing protein/tetratricopeptide (TPR) repeat protein